jgi:hypothetical protein
MNHTILNFRSENQLFEIKNLTYFYILTQSIACASLPQARSHLGAIWDRMQSAIEKADRRFGQLQTF